MMPAVFLLKPSPESRHATQREPVLNSGLVQLTGRLWFVSESAMSGHFLQLSEPENLDKVFRFVTDDLALGDVPALLFDPRTSEKELRYYPRGLAHENHCCLFQLSGVTVSAERIFAVIDRVWRSSLQTPRKAASFPIWATASKCMPGRRAEKTIQAILVAGFAADLLTCILRPEVDVDSGRIDIVIAEADPIDVSKEICHAVVELKVLRSFSNTGHPVGESVAIDAIADGITQASEYAKDKKARVTTLCCFDMRSSHSCGDIFSKEVRASALEAAVIMGLWYLFSSAKQFRNVRRALGSDFREHY